MDLRYPVGPFTPSGRTLTPAERAAYLDVLAAHPAAMRAALDGLTDEQLDTPYREGGWTLRQVTHHVVDSHLNSYCRFKLIATEERPTIRTYDQDAWAALPEAAGAPVELSLALLESLHARWVTFLRAMPDDYYLRVFDHPEVGEMNADALLELYEWHCRHHHGHVVGLRSRRGW